MRYTTGLLSFLLLAPAIGLAQNAVLNLDTSSGNRCAKATAGGLWTVHDATPNNPNTPRIHTLTVTLSMLPVSGAPSRQIVRFLTAGGSADLGCSQGKDGASYQVVSVH